MDRGSMLGRPIGSSSHSMISIRGVTVRPVIVGVAVGAGEAGRIQRAVRSGREVEKLWPVGARPEDRW
jgi:hypothetical protein